ncbi:ParB/RepB/Spo0J family partition protein [Polyangium spumosum]|uniref:ParB/RepB/Spo0J family partition protein n=1 Tax=Polyangium spumosum TaxID=889282 RepID=A0A6N7PGU0_9BACT|nr:ParB/RepB/Spo0J family partition protein [Polyangium spumosum]MRG91273.1 ParB/RepB/Spo0J family partition protein [Polyangium spumosum]
MSTDPKNAPRRALGRGLDALLPAAAPPSPSGASYGDKSVFTCPIERIGPQPGQPRQHFDDEALEELAASIREHGILEPIVVRRAQAGADKYEIIAGERRWRAAQRAGLKDVLVVVKDVSPKDAFELALVENVQREDLNPIELAEAFDRLLREHGYTQESLAERVGKNRTTVTNSLRLLKLPARVRSMVIGGDLSEGHARALLGAPDDKAMEEIADKAVRGRLPVRKVEELVRSTRGPKDGGGKGPKAEGPAAKSPGLKDLEARLMRKLGAKVEVRDKDGKGEIVVAYGSLDELDRILAQLGA